MKNDFDIKDIDDIIMHHGTAGRFLIPILQAIQTKYRYLPADALKRVAEKTEISPAEITGVSTFYTQFRHEPMGEHVINVCVGTACHVKGAGLVHDSLCRELKLEKGRDTDPDGLFTIEKVACLGCCTLAPVVQIDDVTFGHVAPDKVNAMVQDFLRNRDKPPDGAVRTPDGGQVIDGEIRIGLGSCCIASGSGKVQQALEKSLAANGINMPIKRVGCVGMCHRTPLVEVNVKDKPSKLYARVDARDVNDIVLDNFGPSGWVERLQHKSVKTLQQLLWSDSVDPVQKYALDTRDPQVSAFLQPQEHLATEFCGVLDPVDFEEYKRRDGFTALHRCLQAQDREDIIRLITDSGLRGRGGAGFPTGRKWTAVKEQKKRPKYIICNGDEGDPGAFMDRMLLESYPYRIIEGMMIAAYCVGADAGYLYIRAEYPLAVKRIREALQRCKAEGLLGDNILGSGFSLELKIMEGAGAFVCGEESALIASIEGHRGMPRMRPPFPAQKGLWGQPTLVNNTETYALVPWIVRHGAGAFAQLGTEKSKGTKVFALAGKIARGGLIEVPMGMTLRDIVEKIGGGIADGKKFKAVQVGGPSGGCIPARLADIPVDYEALTKAGAMMGSGGLLVMDETDCMVDIARYFLSFTQDQSCGKCTFCRVGTRRMLDILENIVAGQGKAEDIEKLEQLAEKVKSGSLCGLGKTAPNPILTTLRYFRDEYQAHIQGHCPAKGCSALIHYKITEKCIGCTICARHCPVNAIESVPYERHVVLDDKCTRCDTCLQVCPENAVIVE